jgi:microcystin-dependent protein
MSTSPFLSEIDLFAFNFAPHGWAQCNGQLLPINQNQALFALLGTTYGGNGITTFALPDLRGRAALGFGQGPGLSSHALGESTGAESITLTVSQLAAHSHTVSPSAITATARGRNAPGNQQTPVNAVPAIDAASTVLMYATATPTANAGALTLTGTVSAGAVGSTQAHENRQPLLALTFCIALQGIFPSQA